MKKHKLLKRILAIVVGVIVIVLVAGGIWLHTSSYQATPKAATVAQKATESKSYYLFKSKQKSSTNLIFYPGALVDPQSYSLWAKQLAKNGINVYILRLPLNLAVLAGNQAQTVIKENPNETNILAGHSLGGVMAARFTHIHEKQVSGLIFLASYADQKGTLASTNVPVLSISASRDGVLNWENYGGSKHYLPKNTTYETIEGGNHAGFGSYGAQKGDKMATITNSAQQQEISRRILRWRATIDK